MANDPLESWEESSARESYARFLTRLEAGEALEFEDWVREHPESAEELRRLHRECRELEVQLERLARGAAPTVPPVPGDGARVGGAAWRVAAPAVPGLQVGEYRLIARLGKGAMGEVWEAVHFPLQRRVALKLLDPARLTERGVGFFRREARAGGRLNDAGIVAVHATGEDDGYLWLDEELVEGGRTLADFLREVRALGERPTDYFDRVARYVADVARSMQVAHDAFVVHRDLKPGNILIAPDERTKITDFGLARILDETSLSLTGDLVGTYQYMSPEQVARDNGRVDHRTDIFSLGVVLYELLTLERPFDADSSPQVATRILYHQPRDPDRLCADVPRELALICIKALEKAPRRRFASMAEFADELERWLGGIACLTRRPGLGSSVSLWRRRHPTLAVSLALSLASLALLVPLALGLVSAHEERVLAEYSEIVGAVQLALAEDDPVRAIGLAEDADELSPHDPMAQLVLAFGLSRMGWSSEAEAAYRKAQVVMRQRGARADDSANGHYVRALGLLFEQRERGYPEARAALEEVLRAEPDHMGALWTLAQIATDAGDVAVAHDALERYHLGLTHGDPRSLLVEANLLELDGEPERALATLNDYLARDDVGPAEQRAHRCQRLIGRLALATGNLPLAIETLQSAVADHPGERGGWSNLAVALLLASRDPKLGPAAERRAQARAAAERGLELEPGNERDLPILAQLALIEVETLVLEQTIPSAKCWAEADGRVADLLALGFDASELEAELAWLRGQERLMRGDIHGAATVLRAIPELCPRYLRGGVLLAQVLWQLGEKDEALDTLDACAEAWDAETPGWRGAPGDPHLRAAGQLVWRAVLDVWRAALRAERGDAEGAHAARAAVERALDEGLKLPLGDLLTFAEAHIVPGPPTAGDCARASELIEQHGLRAHFASDPQALAILAAIDAACR